ncbi:hypothetical protein GCK72_011474 [Caenorhabditis remanei]|uniref:Uncharacterized protein n=1 Tax=Caenorhabditis remanei TaxID=31234 RepID=A0A6A5H648_CAERE|nr:hypothetical protein GCK72_011474 [Caenorhabditis remanei]KAF1763208.1 hypothetical protein GCK72_011474 [Caenorhabditis remanei]
MRLLNLAFVSRPNIGFQICLNVLENGPITGGGVYWRQAYDIGDMEPHDLNFDGDQIEMVDHTPRPLEASESRNWQPKCEFQSRNYFAR